MHHILSQLVSEALRPILTRRGSAHVSFARPASGVLSRSSSSMLNIHLPAQGCRHISAAVSPAHQQRLPGPQCSQNFGIHSIPSTMTGHAAHRLTAGSSQNENAWPTGSWSANICHANPQPRHRCISTNAAAYAAAPAGGDQPLDSSQQQSSRESGGVRAVAKFVSDQFLPLGLLASMALG